MIFQCLLERKENKKNTSFSSNNTHKNKNRFYLNFVISFGVMGLGLSGVEVYL